MNVYWKASKTWVDVKTSTCLHAKELQFYDWVSPWRFLQHWLGRTGLSSLLFSWHCTFWLCQATWSLWLLFAWTILSVHPCTFFWASSPSMRLSVLCHHPSYVFWLPLSLPVHRYPRLCKPVLLWSLSFGINYCHLLTIKGYNSYVATSNYVRYSLSSLL